MMLFAAVLQSMSLPPSTAPTALGPDVEFGREALAAQHAWRPLLRFTPDGDRTVAPPHGACREQHHCRNDARIASLALRYPALNVSGSKPPSEIDSGRRRVAPSAADRARTIAVVLRPARTWMADSSVCMRPQDCCRHHCSGTRGAPLQRQAQFVNDLDRELSQVVTVSTP